MNDIIVSPHTVINNLRMVYGKPKSVSTVKLFPYKNILGYDVSKVADNDFIYVVFDHNKTLYYYFERVVEDDGDIEKDIKANILKYLPKI